MAIGYTYSSPAPLAYGRIGIEPGFFKKNEQQIFIHDPEELAKNITDSLLAKKTTDTKISVLARKTTKKLAYDPVEHQIVFIAAQSPDQTAVEELLQNISERSLQTLHAKEGAFSSITLSALLPLPQDRIASTITAARFSNALTGGGMGLILALFVLSIWSYRRKQYV